MSYRAAKIRFVVLALFLLTTKASFAQESVAVSPPDLKTIVQTLRQSPSPENRNMALESLDQLSQAGNKNATIIFAKELIKDKDFDKAISLLKPLAAQDNRAALLTLSKILNTPATGASNPLEAIAIDEKLALLGDAGGMGRVAKYVLRGDASLIGNSDLRKMIENAVQNGEMSLLRPLAQLQAKGIGGPADMSAAHATLKMGIDAGIAGAALDDAYLLLSEKNPKLGPQTLQAFETARASKNASEAFKAENAIALGHILGSFGDSSKSDDGIALMTEQLGGSKSLDATAFFLKAAQKMAFSDAARGLVETAVQEQLSTGEMRNLDGLSDMYFALRKRGDFGTKLDGLISKYDAQIKAFSRVLRLTEKAVAKGYNASSATDLIQIYDMASDSAARKKILIAARKQDKLFVHLLQHNLLNLGLRSAAPNGIFDRPTLKEVAAFCATANISSLCAKGPLNRKSLLPLVSALSAAGPEIKQD